MALCQDSSRVERSHPPERAGASDYTVCPLSNSPSNAGQELHANRQPAAARLRRPQHGVMRRLNATGRATLLHCLDGLQGQAACLDDGFISRPHVLSGAVHNTSHAFLDSPVLCVNALNASKILGFLCLAIQQVVVVPISLRAEGRWSTSVGPLPRRSSSRSASCSGSSVMLYSQLYTMVLSSSIGTQMWPATEGLPSSVVEGRS